MQLQIVNEMKENGVEFSEQTYVALIKAFGRKGEKGLLLLSPLLSLIHPALFQIQP